MNAPVPPGMNPATTKKTAPKEVLTAHAMFVDVTGRGHWQVGRLGSR
ncbi:hypothetical protein AB0D40_40865 [Streptomyces massasporeus]